ncbi:MAG: lytic transglycosylase [Gammaproteobacteria bacterium CG11_big_fil_rev_8_21_14_0_20_46_22]|nr:MAG: lytic transglycosylase [Gammaproteobacteria bacterium CG12_big_fil_rev_8_21_14_0_65_46_12]PIR11566.1 MAG: lytic transglycosylase [Gammaproteobacteria bacterium CG11_big_fil_rev_8_21_14_0_20_46_22]
MRKLLVILFSLSIVLCAQARESFQTWLQGFKQQAVSAGIKPQFFDEIFEGMTIGHRQIHLDRTQPEKRLTFLQYRNKRADAYRIKLGRREYGNNKVLLQQLGQEYGVTPSYIVSIWGLETSYGRYMGSFDVIRSLATLAYEGRREDFFRKELVYALKILQEGHVDRKHFKGEWAGGSGHTQFLPSSWHHYAVDHNGDGHKDIWRNKEDALASIANYLQLNGWQRGEPIRVQVILPHGFPENLIGYSEKKPVSAWRAMGVRAADGWHFPRHNLEASIIHPYGGPDYMIFNNWRVIMTYNNSTFYAGTISFMADEIVTG